MAAKEITKEAIIERFKKKKIRTFYDVPDEFLNDSDIIALQRKFGHRISNLRGYDVINQEFFVEESVVRDKQWREYFYDKKKNTFQTFSDYYTFLDGDIYENACYYQYVFSEDLIDTYKINLDKIKYSVKLEDTIDHLKSNVSERQLEYLNSMLNLKKRATWIKKFNKAKTYDDFVLVVDSYQEEYGHYSNINFYIWNYISTHQAEAFDTVIKYLSTRNIYDSRIVYAMCFIFGAENVASKFKYTGMSKSTNYKHNTNLKRFVADFKNLNFIEKQRSFFDINTGYYCTQKDIHQIDGPNYPIATLYRYFKTFKELGKYLNYDFSNCDFTDAFDLSEKEISKFNENTRFPIKTEEQLRKSVSSWYSREDNKFYVNAEFYSQQQTLYESKKIAFRYFPEFIAFLNYDLTDCDLLYCDGLKNIHDFSNLNLQNAKLISSIQSKAGLLVSPSVTKIDNDNFANLVTNENISSLVLQNNRTELSETESAINDDKIYYITDLHLEQRLDQACCKTHNDCIYTIQKIIDGLLSEINSRIGEKELLLIGGDTASTFWIFTLFVKMLKSSLEERFYFPPKVIFTLGNHELWAFENRDLDSIVNEYRAILKENGMYLLQNETLCVFDKGIENLSSEMSKSELKQARAILFGGIGFSGCNEEFNANNGIYRDTLSRNIEIAESAKFKNAYDSLCKTFCKEQIIVLTHMPFEDWYGAKERHENYIYVSGHNHRNEYYDDGVIRVYSDNQIGYSNVQPRLKYFYFSYEFDLFEDYEDGIYEITQDEYRDFYRGKKLYCTCNSAYKIFMLKKNRYYCFIHKSQSYTLSIMNGGNKKGLKNSDINYYYENMDAVIASLKNPLDIYSNAQRQISSMIKKIGGDGTIHGAIIDIDFLNHIYLNPFDFSITPYYATDIIHKIVYPDLGNLLESNCPKYYEKYELLLKSGDSNLIMKSNSSSLKTPEVYLDTDIYSASREIKKMQKLDSNILTIWPENISEPPTAVQLLQTKDF